jgi:hypothetical protein
MGHLRLIRRSIRLSYLVDSLISNYRLMRPSDLGIIKHPVHLLKGLSNLTYHPVSKSNQVVL